ncbi:hypothetical protein DHEL01_v210760 [Diaporthe helianthi]|uniref:Immunoglobulin variable region used by the ITC63B heavy chain n=1 Tax=Diaporthe helianthi TaxID=158607 RepID=A0A2P5HKQ5_DIAHE|nr:hypothetical protein DHEL01_v210760 [Diaporthe helianthi]
MEHDENAVTPHADSCRSVFELGFRTWANLSQRGSGEAKREILEILRSIEDSFPDHPALPRGLNLTKSPGCWQATGVSFWDAGWDSASSDSASISCGPGPPAIAPQEHSFVITKSRPTRLTLQKCTESDLNSFIGDGDDHISILFLAWAYVLSARWTEVIPGANDIQYTENSAESSRKESSAVDVPIMATSREAARWWKAVLAPGQGWLANADTDGGILYSPWSIRLSSSTVLTPIFLDNSPAPSDAADSAAALQYLSEYVAVYGVAEQSWAALAAVLCLPFATRWSSNIALPAPSISQRRLLSQQDKPSAPFSLGQVDKLMVLSCNTQGIEALLLSTFFDPAVPCNLVSPFLQGVFAALDSISQAPLQVIHALSRHSPKVGFLWVGAWILGKHTSLLDHARHGFSEIDLLSAVWTGTTQIFMQLPVSTPSPGHIRREDECRLAYLTSKKYQRNLPFCPWKPFGSVPVKDAELGAQIHAGCRGHRLRYKGWAWDCWDNGRPVNVTHDVPASNNSYELSKSLHRASIEVPYDKLDMEDDSASCTATLNAFMWLRRGGFAASERHIRRHEWICEAFDDEDDNSCESLPEEEDVSDVDAARKRPKSAISRPKLGGWLASTQARRGDSV